MVVAASHISHSGSSPTPVLKEQKCYLANEGNTSAIIHCLESSNTMYVNGDTKLTRTDAGWVYSLEKQEANPIVVSVSLLVIILSVSILFFGLRRIKL